MVNTIIIGIGNLRRTLPNDVSFNHHTFSYIPIDNFVKESIYSINLSIIEGKYIIEDIKNAYSLITSEINQLEFDYPHLLNIKDYLDVTRKCLSKYLGFYEMIRNIYGFQLIHFTNHEKVKRNYYNEFKLLDLNIRLSIIDNNFAADLTILKKLFIIKSELTNINVYGNLSEIHNALEVKVNFLLYKWYLRSAQKEKNIEYDLTVENYKRALPNTLFDDWIEKMLNHYEILEESWRIYFYQQYQNMISISNVNLTFSQTHNKIKYLKDVAKNEVELYKIVVDLNTRINQLNNVSELEKLSYHLLFNYSINNYFSSFCDKQYQKFKLLRDANHHKIIEKCKIIIDDLMDTYENIQNDTKGNLNNFFLDYKVAYFCIKILNEAYEVCTDKFLFIETFNNDTNSKISAILSNYKKKKKWSLLNNNYIFKLDYASSIKNHSNLNVYYASSFTLAKINDDVENRFEEVDNLYKDLQLRFALKYEIETIHTLNEDFKKDNKRIIEVVTIFTAIISFVVGTVGAYNFLKSFEQFLLFLVCYGITISIFVLLMYFANNKLNNYKESYSSRSFKLYKNSKSIYEFRYPVFNYRLLKNSIIILIAYGCAFSVVHLLFKNYQKRIAVDESKKSDSIGKIQNSQKAKLDSIINILNNKDVESRSTKNETTVKPKGN
ncbi:hypothetical protein [Chryseobacterium lathyri]|uniref:hypothetical protein n=1 Tax=Chryseobacterium lathyri TaxID=395933 RepID=UPI001CBA9E3F|nr:hypothetical protein [Chryseobacterium lathyri]